MASWSLPPNDGKTPIKEAGNTAVTRPGSQGWRQISSSSAKRLKGQRKQQKGGKASTGVRRTDCHHTGSAGPGKKSLLLPARSTSVRTDRGSHSRSPAARPRRRLGGSWGQAPPERRARPSPVRRLAPFLRPHLPRQYAPNAVHCPFQTLAESRF